MVTRAVPESVKTAIVCRELAPIASQDVATLEQLQALSKAVENKARERARTKESNSMHKEGIVMLFAHSS